MTWFVNLSIRTKILIGFGVMWIFLVLVAGIAYRALEETHRSQINQNEHFKVALDLQRFRSHQSLLNAKLLQVILQHNTASLMLHHDDANHKRIEREIRDLTQESTRLIEGWVKVDTTPNTQAMYRQLMELHESFNRTREKQLALVGAGKTAEALQLQFSDQTEIFERIRTLATEQSEELVAEIDQRVAANSRESKRSELLFATCAVAALLFGVFMTVLLNKTVSRPLSGLSSLATQVAGGDLSVTMAEDQRRDEVGSLGRAFRQMIGKLHRSTAEIRETVNLLGLLANEILASATQVASGSAETATSISETMTTVEEVRQAAQLSSQKAKNVADSAQRVAQVGRDGQHAVEDVVAGMEQILSQMGSITATIVRLSEQTQSIVGIIAAVTDIADQSNLLAVNAAIEATRAGEQGKAFGVVAQEIKSLAEQSKQATLQVRAILNDVQRATSAAVIATEQGNKFVEAGVRQSTQAGEAILRLAESSHDAVQTATQIVASSQQQVVGMDQIGLAMQNIHQAGGQTAASTTQMETAARSLNELGQKLQRLVEQFRD